MRAAVACVFVEDLIATVYRMMVITKSLQSYIQVVELRFIPR